MDFVDLGNDGHAETRGAWPAEPRRFVAGGVAGRWHGLEHVLRHSPLWRLTDLFARRVVGLAPGAVERGRTARRLHGARRGGRGHAHLGHAFPLAARADERRGQGSDTAVCEAI